MWERRYRPRPSQPYHVMWWPGLGPAATWPLPHKTQGWGQYWGNGQKVSTRLTTSWTQHQTDAGAQQSIRFMVNLAKTLFAFKSSYKQTIIEALLLNIISTKIHMRWCVCSEGFWAALGLEAEGGSIHTTNHLSLTSRVNSGTLLSLLIDQHRIHLSVMLCGERQQRIAYYRDVFRL